MADQPELNILLAVDGSEHAAAAARLLRDLPLPPGSRITALGVLTMRNYIYTPGRAALLDALDQAEAALQGLGAEVRTGLRQGHPAEELCSYAEEHKPDLLVMGAKGLRATLSILLGGVAQQVIENAPCPVLVVRAPYHGLRRLLLASDGSQPSQRAAEFLARFPLPASAAVSVVHVLPAEITSATMLRDHDPAEALSLEAAEDAAAEQNSADERAGQLHLEHVAGLLAAAGVAASGQLAYGDAATEIMEHAQKQHADLIIAGSRGLSGVRGWLLGSASRKLAHYAPCSVMIVR